MVEVKEPKSCTISFSAGFYKLCLLVCWFSLKVHQSPAALGLGTQALIQRA